MSAEPMPATGADVCGYCVGDLVIDVRQRRVSRDGADLEVTSLSFDLLLALVRGAPDLVPSDRLMDEVWRGIVVSPETLTQRVKLLRQSLGDSADSPRYILAVRGHGYRLATSALPFQNPLPHVAESRASPPVEARSARDSAATPRISARWWVPVFAAVLIAATVLAWLVYEGDSDVRPMAFPSRSVAVLPFVNLTGDPSKEYLSDGMAEEMINALGQVRGLKVPARTSSFAYKNRSTDIRRIAQDLGVATILEGSIRSAGERLRITAQLVDARTGYQVWSESYDREFANIFELQEEMVDGVVRAFGHSELADPPIRKAPTRDVEAYRFFLQAESIVNGTPESFLAAIALYDEALARDPSFARALAGRALNRAALAWTGSTYSQGVEQARRDAEAALELDSTQARAHVVLASIAALRGDWSSAEASFRTAIAQNPADPDTRGRYAVSLLLPTGQLQRARWEALEADRLAPGGAFPQAMRAFVEQALGADEVAMRLADASISRGGDPRQMAVVYATGAVRRGAFLEAADHAVKALPAALLDANGEVAFRLAYAALGDPAKRPSAVAALSSLTREPAWEDADPRIRQLVLDLYASLGEIDMLYGEMDRLLRPSDGARSAIITIGSMWSPEMRPFRQDPRFASLVQRLALVDYWQRFGRPDGCEIARESLACR